MPSEEGATSPLPHHFDIHLSAKNSEAGNCFDVCNFFVSFSPSYLLDGVRAASVEYHLANENEA